MTRSRQRGRRPQNTHNTGNRTFDSAGPEVKIRGSAAHVYEKYLQLARDANASGDRVSAENYLQHAEHYYRIMAAASQNQPQFSNQGRGQQPYLGTNGNGRGPNGSSDGTQQPSSEPSFSLAESRRSDDEAGELGPTE